MRPEPAPARPSRGRYAPSPTGEVHLGNASTALVAWLAARAHGGSFVLRLEDLDRPRVRPGLAEQILSDLSWLGLDWDEGPDVGGPFAPYDQLSRRSLYDAAFERLRAADAVYPCFCSRRDIAAAASAPQAPGDEVRYPGTCRTLDPQDAARRVAEGERHAWRFGVPAGARPGFEDLVRGTQRAFEAPADFVVRRSDGVTAYQLAVVVDDAAMRIDQVVRGNDLLPSTGRQLLLFDALEYERPAFAHVPLLLGPDGVRLSKRHGGTTLRELRERGLSAEQVTGHLASWLGLGDGAPVRPGELLPGFDLARLRPAAEHIRVDAARLTRAR